MSGVSLSVDPTSDAEIAPDQGGEAKPKQAPQPAVPGGLIGSLRATELQLVAFVLVFSASGLVPLLDLVFPALASVYLIALSRFAFPANGSVRTSQHRLEAQGSAFFRLYAILGTIIGLLLPLAYVLGGLARGDEHSVRSVTPHLFLLACQILTEIVTSGMFMFSPPVIALVPLIYTVRRIFVIMDWVHGVWIKGGNAGVKVAGWEWFGKWLSMANLGYLSINLLFFLIPRLLPGAFKRYFEEREKEKEKGKGKGKGGGEGDRKMMEDKCTASSSQTQKMPASTRKKSD